jgi:hypothetical protein
MNLDPNNVRLKICKTCPFNLNGVEEIREKVKRRSLTEGNQICHTSQIEKRKDLQICRGARNYQLEIFYRMGVIAEPTDQAWEQKLKEINHE